MNQAVNICRPTTEACWFEEIPSQIYIYIYYFAQEQKYLGEREFNGEMSQRRSVRQRKVLEPVKIQNVNGVSGANNISAVFVKKALPYLVGPLEYFSNAHNHNVICLLTGNSVLFAL